MTESKFTLTIGDVVLFYDIEQRYIALSNPDIQKILIFTDEQFSQAFTKLLAANGADFNQKEG